MESPKSRAQRAKPPLPDERRLVAFTLIEIMIVVGIMGITLTMGVPLVYRVFHRAPMSQAVTDVVEVCSHARAQAILKGQEVDLIFHPREKRMEVGAPKGGSGAAGGGRSGGTNPGASADPAANLAPISAPSSQGSGLSAQLSERVGIEDLDINKIPGGFRDAEVAYVRFFPNGTCDELSLFLVSDRNERCEIMLETTTGLASVEYNPQKFR
jgi:type II secretory pathway pseudopilin PulG